MSWLWSTSALDELVDRATSENLPAGSDDLALNLEICDQIRSKQVSPKDAAKALKRRIGHKNPNVQLLALGLTDVCVKNGGHHFLLEIATREFIDNLTSILKAPAGCNFEVRNRILGLIQTWGRLFRGKQGLGYVCDTYMILQHEGHKFPPVDNIGSALVESEAPPDWTDSDVCNRCRAAFTLTNRKHHCRACGSTFCGNCSSKTMALPNMGVTQEVRVCDGCWMKKKLGAKSAVALESHGLGGAIEVVPSFNKTPAKAATVTSASSTAKPSASTEDEDLLKAIELSLKESNSRPGYSAPAAKPIEVATKKAPPSTSEEEDADLLAAIEASLRETSIHTSMGTSAPTPRSAQRQTSYSSYTYAKKPVAAVASTHELTDTEKSNIEMFSTLVDRIQMMQGDVSGNREVQALYEQISKLQMKVALNLEEAAKKQQEFVGFNDKIDHAVRIYDHLLQEKLNVSYQRRLNSNGYGNPSLHRTASQSMYSPVAATPSTPRSHNVYPNLTGGDSRYAQYVPGLVQESPYGPGQHQQPFSSPYQPAMSSPQQVQPIQQVPPQQQQYAPYQLQVSGHQQQHLQCMNPASPGLVTMPAQNAQFDAQGGPPLQQLQQAPQQQQQPPYTQQSVGPAPQQPMISPGFVPTNPANGVYTPQLSQGGYAPQQAAVAPVTQLDQQQPYQQQTYQQPQQQQKQQQQQQLYSQPQPQQAFAPAPKLEEAPLIEL